MVLFWCRPFVRKHPPGKRRRFDLEALEDRTVPSTFVTAPSFAVGTAPVAVAVADFNGDGHPDLVTANSTAGTVSVLAGKGNGTFGASQDFALGFANLTAVAVGDFNGDGLPDLAVTGQGPTPAGSTTLAPGTVSILPGHGDGTFGAPQNFTVPRFPSGVAVGDFNGDGRLDLAVTAPGANAATDGTVSVLAGNGNGTFGPATSYPVGLNPQSVAVGDVSGDGHPDLVVANSASTSTTVSVLPGNGDGTFAAATNWTVGSNPTCVALADVNGDGRLDVVTANSAPRTVSVLLGNGDGTFAANRDFSTGENPVFVAVGDFNGDGRLDLATADSSSNAVSVLAGAGDGTFGPATVYVGGAGPHAVAVGDFNGDGRADLVTANNGTNNVTLFAGRGDGTFPAPLAVDTPPTLVIGGDFNGDGRPDLLEENSGRVLLGRGDGTFTLVAGTGLPRTVSAAVGDFNGDGRLDVAAINGLNNKASFWLGNGDGTFGPAQVLPAGPGAQLSLAVGDFNGDGKADVVVADNAVPETIIGGGGEIGGGGTVIPGLPPSLNVVMGNGDGTFGAAVTSFPTLFSSTLAVGDFNGDGKSDVVMVSSAASVHLGNGDGTFRKVADYALDNRATAVVVGDFNADGRPDIAVTTDSPFPVFNGAVDAFLGNGDGSFAAARTSAAGYNPSAIAVGDFNQDGIPDVAVAHGLTDAVSILQGNADGTFGPGTTFDAGSDPRSLAVGDYNGDGFPDLAVGNTAFGGPVTVLRNAADQGALAGAVGFRLTTPAGSVAGAPFAVTVTAVDAAGNPVPGFLGTVHFSSSDPHATLPGFYTFTAGDAGSHTFSGVTLYAAGSDPVTAGTPHMTAGSGTVTVSPAAAAHLSVTLPASTQAGSVFVVTVTALDPYGNRATAYTGTVAFTSSDGRAGLPAPTTFTAGDAGVHTFTATLKTAGFQSIAVMDTGTTSISGSGGITVTPLAAASLVVLNFPSPIVAGIAGGLMVEALDPYGNLATGYSGTVSFASSDPQAALPGTVSVSGGIGTFSATLKTAGTQSITASDTATASLSGTQNGILVKPAAASKVVLSGFAWTTTAGVAGSFTVTALDPYGNTATGYTGTVHFSSSDAQAGLPADYTFTTADAGAHTFSATLKTAGSQAITATDTATATMTSSQAGIVVSAAAAASVTVTGFPATTAGVAHTFTVTLKDAFGNVATGYTGTVVFRSSDAQAGLPASYAFTSADAGIHTFTATLKTAGTQLLTVSDAASPTITGSQSGIAVTAAAVSRLGITAPAGATQGKPFTVTVAALDAFGNVVTGYRGKVHFSSTDPKAGLSSDYTFGANDNGTHAFSVTFNTLGLQTLLVNDTTNTSIKGSATINVVAQTSGGGGGGGGGGG